MTLVASCQCGQSFAASPHLAGKTLPCPACGRALTVPTQAPAALQPIAPKQFAPDPFAQPSYPPTAGKPAYQQPGGRPATAGGLSLQTKLLIGGAAGGGLLLLGLVAVMCYWFLGSSARVAGGPAMRTNSGPPPGFGMPPPGFQPTPWQNPPHITPPPRPSMPSGSSPARPGFGQYSSSPNNSPRLAMSSPFQVAGQFTIDSPTDCLWKEKAIDTYGGVPSRLYQGDRPRTKGFLTVRVAEIPQAKQDQREAVLERTAIEISKAVQDAGKTLGEIKGLEVRPNIPDTVEFTYTYTDEFGRKLGGGRLVFGTKRIAITKYLCTDNSDAEFLRAVLRTYREL
ncbi:hypothetical protein ETAA8_07200 [Anatilimnocola aggregata]|uniref:Uncharacterized protein n=1 Tax=Anatilimnocola aggregata TaxID=2528021 RepID=A0A517Y607_9BACT|nr:hypothetical protein [Anatilimnocola aggregata]QDU25650.1 hypothetical protein ETAA8_07200 [Anatilimnocola aggregata]